MRPSGRAGWWGWRRTALGTAITSMIVCEYGFVEIFWLGDESFGDLIRYNRAAMGIEDGIKDLKVRGSGSVCASVLCRMRDQVYELTPTI